MSDVKFILPETGRETIMFYLNDIENHAGYNRLILLEKFAGRRMTPEEMEENGLCPSDESKAYTEYRQLEKSLFVEALSNLLRRYGDAVRSTCAQIVGTYDVRSGNFAGEIDAVLDAELPELVE